MQIVEYNKDDNLSKTIDQLCTKLLNFSDLFLLQAYKVNIAYKACESMKELIAKTEEDIKELEKEAAEAQKHAKVYVQDDDDIVDKAVSNSLKEFGKPLNVGLVKISNGVYLCEKNRINIRFVSNKLKVRDNDLEFDFIEYLNKINPR